MVKLQRSTKSAGGILFAILFLAFAVFLLTQLSVETKFSNGKQLFAQPRFWPGVGVLGMMLFGLGHLAFSVVDRKPGLLPELATWLQSLEYLLWFMIYVFAVPIAGYLITSIIFMCALSYRQGYRSAKWMVLATIIAVSIVVAFKTFLSVKIPGGAVYEWLPDGIRSFMIVNF